MHDTACQHNHSLRMKAALKTPKGEFEVEEVDTPRLPGPDWTLVRIRVAGICGTDLRHWQKEEPELIHEIMGHEMAGEVVEVGEAVKNVKAGDRVVVETVLGDDNCDWCRVQQYNICPELYPVRMETVSRAFATYVIAPAKKLYKLPDHVSFEEATLLDTFSVGLHAVQLSGLKLNDKVLVIGAGSIGLGQLQLAKIAGADVLITDIVDSSLELARELGADVVVNSDKEDVEAAVKAFTGGRGADITFECAGGTAMPLTLPKTVACTRRGGKIVLVGGFDKGEVSIGLDWQDIQMGEKQIIPSASYAYWGIYPEMQICLDLLAKGKLNARKMISHSFPLDRINEGFATARDKAHTGALFVALTID
ncbi:MULTISPECIES: zinc-binding dehydrogenase [Asticcacaulis]|uniref:zinc-dependent alcohol dehydrogenase n=1 Tax=Asticcacaulis TaxID=76890 RepID=UPI001AEB9461|nr:MULTISPECIES: zinc-binding dehydrogenase [Asticcacaulis]MBP2159361.1 L-iditol 2-dehydrogenase [Asticcacaulis solisilvae]MDR6800406.1 L-iditol 2-dehydrogenase [Asticcacaulis sp. BE141]